MWWKSPHMLFSVTIDSPAAPRLSSSRCSTLPRYHGVMCSSPVRRKEQKFNYKSTGATRTMLIMAVLVFSRIHYSIRHAGTYVLPFCYVFFGNRVRAKTPAVSARMRGISRQHCSSSLNAETKARCSLAVQAVLLRPLTDLVYQEQVNGLMFCAGVLITVSPSLLLRVELQTQWASSKLSLRSPEVSQSVVRGLPWQTSWSGRGRW